MKPELKVGDKAWIQVEIQTTRDSGGHVIGLGSAKHSALAFPEQLIPIPKPLPAPNCEGPWANIIDGVLYAREIERRDGELGYYTIQGDWHTEFILGGTWLPIDPRLVGVEVEPSDVEKAAVIAEAADAAKERCASGGSFMPGGQGRGVVEPKDPLCEFNTKADAIISKANTDLLVLARTAATAILAPPITRPTKLNP